MQSQQSPGRTSAAYVLILVGILLFVGQNFQLQLADYLWPFSIILPGLALLAGMVIFGKTAAPLAVPGTIVTATGLLLLYQNTFNQFESWAYAWALIAPGSVGVGLWLQGLWAGIPRLQYVGARLAAGGVVLFVLFFLSLGGVVGISGDLISRIVLPGLLILIALGMLLPRRERPRL